MSESTTAAMEAFALHVEDVMFSHDPARIGALLHPDFHVWQNSDGLVVDGKATDEFHRDLAQRLQSLTFIDRKIIGTETGYVDQHIKVMVTKDGTEYRVPAAMIVTVRDNKLFSVREYMDSTHFPREVIEARQALAEKAKHCE